MYCELSEYLPLNENPRRILKGWFKYGQGNVPSPSPLLMKSHFPELMVLKSHLDSTENSVEL